ncbi:MAG: hypothetical protein NC543_08565 [bacterium]|nr:hypothetical protein [bacterium]MCM1375497.1 hypothetical protein [Muribaculum sp.]
MIAKRIVASVLAVGLMLANVPMEAQAADCTNGHGVVDRISYSEWTTGTGYQHSYTGTGGTTKGCGVTIMAYTATYQCQRCLEKWVDSGTFERHNTNHT